MKYSLIAPIPCHKCSFTDFCFTEQSAHQCSTLPTGVVKQHLALKPKQQLHSKQQLSQTIYVVRSGVLKAYTSTIQGKEQMINFYLPGEALGFETINELHAPFSIAATVTAEVCEIPLKGLLNHIRTNSELLMHFLKLSSRQFERYRHMTYTDAEQRLAVFLLDLMKRLGLSSAKPEFYLPLTREQIAAHLNLATETISRLLLRLSQKGIIALRRRFLMILNFAALESYL